MLKSHYDDKQLEAIEKRQQEFVKGKGTSGRFQMPTFYRGSKLYRRMISALNRSRPKRSGKSNFCQQPSRDASKADLQELHQEKMRLKKAHQRIG